MRRRPEPLPPGFAPHHAPRFKRFVGKPYVPDVIERVRVLVEGTALSQAAIAARTGIGATTVNTWIKRRRWTRPQDAARWPRAAALDRADLGRRFRLDFEIVQRLAEEAAGRLEQEMDPKAVRRARDLAERARRAAFVQDTHAPGRRGRLRVPPDDGFGLIRLSTQPPGGQGQPYEDDVVAGARRLVETTTMGRDDIARQVGVCAMTISRWTRANGWVRPYGAPVWPRSRRRPDGRLLSRLGAMDGLGEAEDLLDALRREPKPDLDDITRAWMALLAARSAFRASKGRGGDVRACFETALRASSA